MITQKGRVVYDRVAHKFEVKDVARILWSEIKFLDPGERAVYVVKVLWMILFHFLRDPAARRRFLRGLLDGILGWAGEVQIVPDYRLTSDIRFRGLPSGDEETDNGIEGGPENGQGEGPLQQ